MSYRAMAQSESNSLSFLTVKAGGADEEKVSAEDYLNKITLFTRELGSDTPEQVRATMVTLELFRKSSVGRELLKESKNRDMVSVVRSAILAEMSHRVRVAEKNNRKDIKLLFADFIEE